MGHLENVKIAILLAKMHEEIELWYPAIRLKEAGAKVVIVGEEAGKKVKGKHDVPATTDKAYKDVKADDFTGLVIPGGFGPDYMRKNKDCLKLVKDFHNQDKMIAFICHAGWLPISCGILKGVKATSVINIKDDMVNAGVQWEDKPLVVDGHFLSSRDPDDLGDFMKGIIKYLQEHAK
ncbi:MAG: type 1 glutamine amidotransferase [Planctomycetaceae bacterium]|nr:type 1 glutamine amidotransferase [Planctomycetaceae bacterium]